MHWFSFSPWEEQQIMFKRLSHAHSLTLAIWFLFRNMKTCTELSYLQHRWLSLRLQICKTCRCDLRSCYLHSQGTGCCHQELECGCYSGSTWSQKDNCWDKPLTPHPILTTRSPAIPVSSWLPPYHRKTVTCKILPKHCIWISRFCQSYMLSCGANMRNMSSNPACNQ